MYDAPIKFRLTQQFGSAKCLGEPKLRLAKIHKSWPIYTLVHNIYSMSHNYLEF